MRTKWIFFRIACIFLLIGIPHRQKNRFGYSKHQCTQHLPAPYPLRSLAGGICSTCLGILITWNSMTARSLQSGAVLLQPSTTTSLMCACNYDTSPPPPVSVCWEGKRDGCWLPNTVRPRSMTTNEDRHQLLLKDYRPIRGTGWQPLSPAVASCSESTSPHYNTNRLVFFWPTCNSLHVVDWNISGVSSVMVGFFFCAKRDYTIKCCQLNGESVIVSYPAQLGMRLFETM